MSKRYSLGGVISATNPFFVPDAPRINSVTAGNVLISVNFTAPTNTGNSAITSHIATARNSVTGVSTSNVAVDSPIIINGLTANNTHTVVIAAINSYGVGATSSASDSATPFTPGEQLYMTPGTYSWVAPANVTNVSVVAVGAGGSGGTSVNCCGVWVSGGGGSGGGLGYKNNYSVTPGVSYTVVVGLRGDSRIGCKNGGDSYFVSTAVVKGGGGPGTACYQYPCAGGTYTGDGGGNGGRAGQYAGPVNSGGGGGGAGGYTGAGGAGGTYIGCGSCIPATAGAGGGGGGGGRGSSSTNGAGGGGGVGLYGAGSNGAAGAINGGGTGGGGAGSCGTAGTYSISPLNAGGKGGNVGGGGGGTTNATCSPRQGTGGCGGIRIIWPGWARSFPSTNTGIL